MQGYGLNRKKLYKTASQKPVLQKSYYLAAPGTATLFFTFNMHVHFHSPGKKLITQNQVNYKRNSPESVSIEV